MVLPKISIPFPIASIPVVGISVGLLCDMEVIDLAEVLRKAKLASMPPKVLEDNMLDFASTLGKLKNFADTEQRSMVELAQDVDLTTTWARLREDISQKARDFHNMEEFIEARRHHKMHWWVRHWWQVKQA